MTAQILATAGMPGTLDEVALHELQARLRGPLLRPGDAGYLQAWAGWNGMIFGHWENTLLVCEPYRPFAWPDKYKIALPHKINATIVDGASLIVLTTGPAYMIYGAHPSLLQHEPPQEVAKKYLNRDNLTVATLDPQPIDPNDNKPKGQPHVH